MIRYRCLEEVLWESGFAEEALEGAGALELDASAFFTLSGRAGIGSADREFSESADAGSIRVSMKAIIEIKNLFLYTWGVSI